MANDFFFLVDEINWPEKDEAPPPDAQDLITLLLRQNPLERLGTGQLTCVNKQEIILYVELSEYFICGFCFVCFEVETSVC